MGQVGRHCEKQGPGDPSTKLRQTRVRLFPLMGLWVNDLPPPQVGPSPADT